MILYGIPTCDTCKKAIKSLESAGYTVTFRDVRAEPLSPTEISDMVIEFGDNIINRQSTTWRGLSDWLKASDPEEQIAAQPTLMKRPVIVHEDVWYLGWGNDVQGKLLK